LNWARVAQLRFGGAAAHFFFLRTNVAPNQRLPRLKQFMDNESFRRWLTDMVFGLTYEKSGA